MPHDDEGEFDDACPLCGLEGLRVRPVRLALFAPKGSANAELFPQPTTAQVLAWSCQDPACKAHLKNQS